MSGKAGPTTPSNPEGLPHQHGNAVVEGVSTALSWMTIVPLRGAQTFDRITGRRAIAALPVAGLVPGLAAAIIAAVWVSWRVYVTASSGAIPSDSVSADTLPGTTAGPSIALQALVIGVMILIASEVLTRAMHIDGLADVADALGSYRDVQGAQKILRDPATGPMGIGAIGLYFAVMAAGLAAISASLLDATVAAVTSTPGLGALVLASRSGLLALIIPFVAGRAAATTACHRRFPAMSETGFGALTAATQSVSTILPWWVVIVLGGWLASGISGVIGCVAALAFSLAMARHSVRRLGGINGDVLGTIIHVATAMCVVFFAF